MKIICLKKYLKEAISLCERITGKNLSLPILNNVLISGEGRSLKFTATNLEIGLEVEIPAKVEKKGKVAVPAGVVNNFLANFTGDENIIIEVKNNNLLISTSNSSTLIKSQSPEDFPLIPHIKTEKPTLIPVEDILTGLKSVYYSCSVSNIKPEISSVLFSSNKGKPAYFVATDSFRLAEKKVNFVFQEDYSLLIPFRTVTEILRIFDGRDGKIELVSDKNQISLKLDNIRFISRLTEGIFPDYKQIIPKKFVTDVIIDKDIFINSLKTAGIFSGKLNELNVIVGNKNKSITIKTSNVDTGEHIAQIPAQVTGEELKMTFNHKYIFDCLSSIPSEKIILRFSGESSPLVITSTDDNSFQYLVMPMHGV